mgnify:CR=1 FL=1
MQSRSLELFPSFAVIDEFTVIQEIAYFNSGDRCTYQDDPDACVIKLPENEGGYVSISLQGVELPTLH